MVAILTWLCTSHVDCVVSLENIPHCFSLCAVELHWVHCIVIPEASLNTNCSMCNRQTIYLSPIAEGMGKMSVMGKTWCKLSHRIAKRM